MLVNVKNRGRKKVDAGAAFEELLEKEFPTEGARAAFEADVHAKLAAAQAPQAPPFRTCLASPRLTAQAALEALRAQGYGAAPLPSPSTRAAVRKRLGFRLRKVVQAKPQKKRKETDAIFDNSKKKPRTPSQQDASNDGVSMVKRR